MEEFIAIDETNSLQHHLVGILPNQMSDKVDIENTKTK